MPATELPLSRSQHGGFDFNHCEPGLGQCAIKVARRVDLKSVGEPQGEAVAFGPSSTTVYVAGEGGGKSQPGTLAVLSCAK